MEEARKQKGGTRNMTARFPSDLQKKFDDFWHGNQIRTQSKALNIMADEFFKALESGKIKL